jgi:acetoacetate decarboxylase
VVKLAIFPEPLAAVKPVVVFEFVQLYCVPATSGVLEKVTAFEAVPVHFT